MNKIFLILWHGLSLTSKAVSIKVPVTHLLFTFHDGNHESSGGSLKKSDKTKIFSKTCVFFLLEVVYIKELALYNVNIRRHTLKVLVCIIRDSFKKSDSSEFLNRCRSRI